MKKRIIAILLVISVFCFSLPRTEQRAYADPVTVTAVVGSVLIAAFSLLVCATAAPGTSISGYGGEFSGGGGGETFFDESETYTILQDGVVNSSGDIVYQNNVDMLTQLGALAKVLQSEFDKGELVRVDNNYVIKNGKLNKVIEKANQSISVMAKPNIDFKSGYNATFLSLDLTKPFLLETLPVNSEFLLTLDGQSYARVFLMILALFFHNTTLFFIGMLIYQLTDQLIFCHDYLNPILVALTVYKAVLVTVAVHLKIFIPLLIMLLVCLV